MADFHQPVLVNETVTTLNCHPGGIYVDGTIGGGSHAYHVFKTCPDIKLLIGIDRDEDALLQAERKLASFKSQVVLIKENYSQIKTIISDLQIKSVDGVLLDLGVSSHQLLTSNRGFSFSIEGPLDMRMDRKQQITASDLVNTLPEQELEKILREYGEERYAASIAKTIVRERKKESIETTLELAKVVTKTIPFSPHPRKIHPATRTFQALRIAVNDEFSNLESVLPDAIDTLAPRGRIAVISFHSLEDRIVKNFFRQQSKSCVCPPHLPKCACGQIRKLKVLTKKPIVPTAEEIRMNPRSRSARLRGAEKL
ncbi:MAG: S-adenosyl-methyltransferase mraW [Deltaproteobacteria bacterium]|nr:S-adenosyl-methyltransferase mraW [Deltaproteobacteria bacterium]